MKNNQKGFTLAELLVVVAIIAVLVAVAIPTFANQLEKSRQAVDISDLRSAYAAARLGSMNDMVDGVKISTNAATAANVTFYYDRASGGLLKTTNATGTITGYSKGNGNVVADTNELPTQAKTAYTGTLTSGRVIKVVYQSTVGADGLYDFTMSYDAAP